MLGKKWLAAAVAPILLAGGFLVAGVTPAFAGTTPSIVGEKGATGSILCNVNCLDCCPNQSGANMLLVQGIATGTTSAHVTAATGYTQIGGEEHSTVNTTDTIQSVFYKFISAADRSNGYTVPLPTGANYMDVYWLTNVCDPSVCTDSIASNIEEGSSISTATNFKTIGTGTFSTDYSNELAVAIAGAWQPTAGHNLLAKNDYPAHTGGTSTGYTNKGGYNNAPVSGVTSYKGFATSGLIVGTEQDYTLDVNHGAVDINVDWVWHSIVFRNHE